MMGILKAMLCSVVAAALLGGAAMTLIHAGAMKEIVRLAAGMMMILALLRPMSGLRLTLPAAWFQGSTEPVRQQVEQSRTQWEIWMAESSAREVGAYLERKAKKEGVDCRIELRASMQKDGAVSLDSATVYASSEERTKLTRLLEDECGIPKERQTYVEE